MSERRRSIRVAPRGKVPSACKIILGGKAGSIDCRIVDISSTGACLDVPTTVDFPPRFEFVHGNTRKQCRLVWKQRFRIGITFNAGTQGSALRSGLSRSIAPSWR